VKEGSKEENKKREGRTGRRERTKGGRDESLMIRIS
jgi:hypothetical protein